MLYSGVDKGAPSWLAVLQMAEEWGTPPWEIMAAPGSVKWAARRAAYHRELAWVREQQSKK